MNETEYAESIIKPLLDSPEQLSVNRSLDEMGVLLTVSVAKADMGKVIGRSGETAKCIRNLLRVFGSKINSRVSLKINEPDGAEVRPV